MCKNMNPLLAQAVGMRNYHPSSPRQSSKWTPPPVHGMDNSCRIIPEYYMTTNTKNPHKILRINYYDIIIDDIRNLRPLNPTQLDYIRNKLDTDDIHTIIEEFNQVIQTYETLFEEN